MPTHKIHDPSTILAAVPFAIVGYFVYGADLMLLGLAGFVFAGLVFSPDLDLPESAPTRRWGPLRLLWRPYQKVVPHRSWLSHAPIVGTALRILWVAILASPALAFALVDGQVTDAEILRCWARYKPEIVAVLVGLEAGALVHVLIDSLIRCPEKC